MSILSRFHSRLSRCDGDFIRGGEAEIADMLEAVNISLPDDYLDFLKDISGGSEGVTFLVDDDRELWMFDAAMVLEKRREFDLPILRDFIDTICMIGNDLGDLVYFYGTGAEGFGIYRCGVGCLGYQHSVKLADTFTDLFVNGVGINALF